MYTLHPIPPIRIESETTTTGIGGGGGNKSFVGSVRYQQQVAAPSESYNRGNANTSKNTATNPQHHRSTENPIFRCCNDTPLSSPSSSRHLSAPCCRLNFNPSADFSETTRTTTTTATATTICTTDKSLSSSSLSTSPMVVRGSRPSDCGAAFSSSSSNLAASSASSPYFMRFQQQLPLRPRSNTTISDESDMKEIITAGEEAKQTNEPNFEVVAGVDGHADSDSERERGEHFTSADEAGPLEPGISSSIGSSLFRTTRYNSSESDDSSDGNAYNTAVFDPGLDFLRKNYNYRTACEVLSRDPSREEVLPGRESASKSTAVVFCEQDGSKHPRQAPTSGSTRQSLGSIGDDGTSCKHPEALAMKLHRKHTRATYVMGGAAVGTMLLPVVGTVVGGALSGYSVNLYLKRKEKHAQRKWDRDNFQTNADASPVAKYAVFV